MRRSLALFHRYSEVARRLESYKHVAVYGKSSYRAIARCATRNCEDVLDDAWEIVGVIGEGYGDLEAGLVAAHYLFLEPWTDVAAEAELSVWQARWRAYKALGWLERNYGDSKEEDEAASGAAGRRGAAAGAGDSGERRV